MITVNILSIYCNIARYKSHSPCLPPLFPLQIPLPSTNTILPLANLLADVLFQEHEAEEEQGGRSSEEDDPDGQ